jgi:hypothetical protein
VNMSPAKAKENRAMIKVKSVRYPFVHRQKYAGLIRPEEFEAVFKSISYCRIPVHNNAYWMFETAMDMDLFKEWENNYERIRMAGSAGLPEPEKKSIAASRRKGPAKGIDHATRQE